jgi:peptide/nickel transport system substrate-binding protein
MDDVVYIPTGFYKGFQAWRSNISGVVGGPLPFFWNVKKA